MTYTDRVNELHEQAMQLAESAYIARLNGETETATQLTRQALDYESAAANLVAYTSVEPSRSILHRSAATLAFNCGEFRVAERLIAVGLAGDPPDDVAHELRELLVQVLEQTLPKQAIGN